jgi:hypothetical protein
MEPVDAAPGSQRSMSNSQTQAENKAVVPPAADASVLLAQWLNGIRINEIANYRTATFYDKRSRLLGLTVTFLSVLVGTSLFTGLGSSNIGTVVLVAGVVSAIAAVASGAQTFLNYAQLSEKARATALSYGVLRHKLEEGMAEEPDKQKLMDDVRKEFDQTMLAAPTIPQRIHDEAVAYVNSHPLSSKLPPA